MGLSSHLQMVFVLILLLAYVPNAPAKKGAGSGKKGKRSSKILRPKQKAPEKPLVVESDAIEKPEVRVEKQVRVLRMKGRQFLAKKDFSKAAYCYAGILQLHKDLIAKRLNRYDNSGALAGHNTDIIALDYDARFIATARYGDGEKPMLVVFNCSANAIYDYPVGLHNMADNPQLVFNSDARIYHDSFGDVGHAFMRDGQLLVTIGAYTCLIFH